jgi:hypothetical protein
MATVCAAQTDAASDGLRAQSLALTAGHPLEGLPGWVHGAKRLAFKWKNAKSEPR